MFATSLVCWLEQTKDERRKRNNQQIGTEMPGMYNVKQIQHGDREKYQRNKQEIGTVMSRMYNVKKKYTMVTGINTIEIQKKCLECTMHNTLRGRINVPCQTNTPW